jgi:hypothetical protein
MLSIHLRLGLPSGPPWEMQTLFFKIEILGDPELYYN